jgi:hypothetical protein
MLEAPSPNTLRRISPPFIQVKKAESAEVLSFGSSAIFDLMRPAAFRPTLMDSLALSEIEHKTLREGITTSCRLELAPFGIFPS